MTQREIVCQVMSFGAGILGFGAAGYAVVKYLTAPETTLDWICLASAALVVGTVAYFVVWGHFQRDPKVN